MRAVLAQKSDGSGCEKNRRDDRLKLERRGEKEATHRDAALVEISNRAIRPRESLLRGPAVCVVERRREIGP